MILHYIKRKEEKEKGKIDFPLSSSLQLSSRAKRSTAACSESSCGTVCSKYTQYL
jgi:hypothetical protein